jgi:PTS system galactitol-specific IIC component
LAVSLVLVPLTVFLAVVLPGNKVLPFADLAVIPFMFVLIIPIVKNNGFRAIIIGFVTLALGLWIATDLAPWITIAAVNANFDMPIGADQISSICDGANPLTWGIVRIMGLGSKLAIGDKLGTMTSGALRGIGILITAAAAVGLAIINRGRIVKEAKALRKAQ